MNLQKKKLRGPKHSRVWAATSDATTSGTAASGGLLFLCCYASQPNPRADQLLVCAPRTLLFVLPNAFREEIHFCGLRLKPFKGPRSRFTRVAGTGGVPNSAKKRNSFAI